MKQSNTVSADSGISREAILIGVVALIALLGVLFLSSQRQQVLRQSPSGFDGLSIWLNSQGHDAESFSGGWRIETETLGLNIVPLYDANLRATRERPETREEMFFQRDENDRTLGVLTRKANTAKTLFILPKWRSGMRLTGMAHPKLLIDEKDTGRVLHDLVGARVGRLRLISRPFLDFDYNSTDGQTLQARLYAAQVFDGVGCDAIIGTENRMVLGKCPLGPQNSGQTAFVLSDPDLFSNHGLRLGDNARIAEDFLSDQANGQRILVDYSRENWLWSDVKQEVRARTWADLKQFFAYPFSVIWAAAACVMGLVLWRAGLRFGPIAGTPETFSASKLQMIKARSRLLRLTGEDGALLAEYTRARLASTACQVFGNAYMHRMSDRNILTRHVERNDPKLAGKLRELLAAIDALPQSIPASEAIAYVDNLENILERLTNDT